MIVRSMFCKGARLKAFSTGMLMVLDKLKSNLLCIIHCLMFMKRLQNLRLKYLKYLVSLLDERQIGF